MKTLLVSLFLVSNFSFAAGPIAGGVVNHELKCRSTVNDLVGSAVKVNVFTQALAPQYNIRGIQVSTTPVYPNAKPTVYNLKQSSQTAYNAVFKGKEITAELDKARFEVELKLGAIEYKCK